MRFWITKNSEIPLREQLVHQVIMGILSEDLPAGEKLPSVRALARRHRIHANTVSAAYHDLLEQGWLELRRGSGVYVCAKQESEGKLDALLASLLKTARAQGYGPEEVLERLERMVRTRSYSRILVAEPDPAMGEIVLAEIRERVKTPAEIFEAGRAHPDALVVALPTRAAGVKSSLPKGITCLTLRVTSVGGSLEGREKPSDVVTIVSRSAEIRRGARAMLIAAGLDPLSLCDIDSGREKWRGRIGANAFVVTDVVTARDLPQGVSANVYRVIADSSIDELNRLCRPTI